MGPDRSRLHGRLHSLERAGLPPDRGYLRSGGVYPAHCYLAKRGRLTHPPPRDGLALRHVGGLQ
eukprot:2014525-Alexandrium_andersonii.AAC.1